MTDDQIIREVAEKVMGLILRRITIPESVVTDEEYWENDQGNFVFWRKDFNPLTNANHMMLVVEKMREKGWRCRIVSYLNIVEVNFWTQDEFFVAYHDETGHAVCLAALQAEGGE